MKRLLSVIVLGFAFLISGCGDDDGKYAGVWEATSTSGKWIYQYELTKKDNGYKAFSKERLNKDGSEFKTTSEMFLEKSGSYLDLDKKSHFLEIKSDNELKLVSSEVVFHKINGK
ncbi:putative lipoprotein (plasmid) [Yersinia frederiksenii Y225]|nr:putative lipoprotein [Yersinia frederiksenii Y225]